MSSTCARGATAKTKGIACRPALLMVVVLLLMLLPCVLCWRGRTGIAITTLSPEVVASGDPAAAADLESQQPVWERPGDLQLGVVLSLTAFNKNQLCGTTLRQTSALHRLHAIVFALEEINRIPDLLPNVTLGFVVMDDCSRDAAALMRALRFVRNPTCPSSEEPESPDPVPMLSKSRGRDRLLLAPGVKPVKIYDVVGVIGAELSECSMQMAALLSAFRIPQLSYASSSPFLSDKNRFRYFSRIVPSDRQQANVIVDMLEEFNWNYVAVVYSYGVYGLSGFRYIRNFMEAKGFCLARAIATESEFNDDDYDNKVIEELVQLEPKVKVVVLFTLHAKDVLRAAKRRKINGQFIWVSSDALVPNIKDFKNITSIAAGLLVVGFESGPVKRFEDKFQNFSLENSFENPWFKKFYEVMFDCTVDKNNGERYFCNPKEPIRNSPLYEKNTSVMRAVNSVYAFARALHEVTRECPHTGQNVSNCFTPEDLLASLRRTHFTGENDVEVAIDQVGDGIASYQISNLRLDHGNFSFAKVGEWNGRSKDFSYLNKEDIVWHPAVARQLVDEGEAYPRSTCRKRCGVGEEAEATLPRCCWVCKKCRENEFTQLKNDTPVCHTCPSERNFSWPDPGTRTACEPIPVHFVSLASPEGLALLMLDLLVLALVLSCTALYVRHRANRLIKATSRELSAVMISGHLLACCAVGVLLAEPSRAPCVVGHALFHVSLTLVYAPLLVKINRIHRIFVSGKRSARPPRFISSGFQLAVSLAVVLVHLLFIVAWMIWKTPTQQTRMPSLNERYVERVCLVSEHGFLASLVINLVLMAACAVHSLSTRKLPANFNEAKFITICIYTIVVLWLSFLATYFVVDKGFVHTLCLALALLVNVISCQVFLFVPKLYAVLKVPTSKLKVQGANESSDTTAEKDKDRNASETQGMRSSSDGM